MELRGKVVGRGTADISRCSSFTYYANLAWAVVILTIGRLCEATHPVLTVIGAVLLIAHPSSCVTCPVEILHNESEKHIFTR